MNITQITVSYGETQSLPEYSNVKPNVTLTAQLGEGDSAEAVEQALWLLAKQSVHEQIDLALEANDKAAKYSTEPRFQVLRTYQGYSARGRIEQPKIVVILPDGMHLPDRLDQRLGSPSYRETKKLRYAHAMRMAIEYAHDQECQLLDCANGDISRLEALLPAEPEQTERTFDSEDARAQEHHSLEYQAAMGIEPEEDFDEEFDEDEE